MIVKIKDARYAGTIYEKLPQLPEIAFAGRSNVGKSSLINTLLNRKSLVKTSKLPGKTRNINFFQVDMIDLPSIYMVDLPGYGYAKVPQDMKDTWDKLAATYFNNNQNLKLLVLLVDIRRELKDEEFMLYNLVKDTSAQILLVATKTDKVSFSEMQKQSAKLFKQTGISPVISSAMKRSGIDTIWEHIIHAIKNKP